MNISFMKRHEEHNTIREKDSTKPKFKALLQITITMKQQK